MCDLWPGPSVWLHRHHSSLSVSESHGSAPIVPLVPLYPCIEHTELHSLNDLVACASSADVKWNLPKACQREKPTGVSELTSPTRLLIKMVVSVL